MKQHIKFFLFCSLILILGIVFGVSQRQESNSIMGCSVITEKEVVALISGKSLIDTPSDLLCLQEQALPYRSDLNTFLVPVTAWREEAGNITCGDYEHIYFVLEENQELDEVWRDKTPLSAYIIDDSFYIKTFVIFTSSIILTFQTNEFENGNAYGEVKLYTPDDDEINMYSYKHSEAKLSYEDSDGLLPSQERNYTLKLFKNGAENKMRLAGLRKDDDWELNPLLGCSASILQFYDEWNAFCLAEGDKRFTMQYQIVELYLDGQFMGEYLLQVPIDNKQLQDFQGIWLDETDINSAIYGSKIQELFHNVITDTSLYLDCSFWQEKSDGDTLYAIPKKIFRIYAAESE